MNTAPKLRELIMKHRHHVELSPGVGEDAQHYALAVIDNILIDVAALAPPSSAAEGPKSERAIVDYNYNGDPVFEYAAEQAKPAFPKIEDRSHEIFIADGMDGDPPVAEQAQAGEMIRSELAVLSSLRDSAQLSTLPAWCRSELSTAADLIDQLRKRLAEVELLNRQLRQDFDNAAWEAESKLAETDRIIRRLWSLMGPKTPPCCEGCTFEWIEALKELRAYLGSDAYPAVPPTIQGPST